jgi:hypothetical protein
VETRCVVSVPNRFSVIETVCHKDQALFGTDASRYPILLDCLKTLRDQDGPVWALLCKTDKSPAEWAPTAPGFVPSDVLVYTPELTTVDVLTGPQGAQWPTGGPGWQVQGQIDGITWRPYLPGDTPSPSPTPPPSTGHPYNESYAVEFGLGCNDVYHESGAPMDAGMISVVSQRAAWDYYVGGMAWPDSKRKHLNELRKEYGLPPV